MRHRNKEAEFTINDIVPIAAALIVAGIFIGYGQKINSDIKAQLVNDQAVTATCNATSGTYTGCGYAYNSTNDASLGVSKLSSQFPTIGLVAAAVVVIGMLGYLVFNKK